MTGLLHDLRHAVRLCRRAPGTAAVIVGSLALGIGANTAVFSFVNAIQFKPLPVADEATLVDVSEWSATELCSGCGVGTSYPGYLEWTQQARSFSAVAAYKEDRFTVSGEGEPERAGGVLVSANLFPVLGARPVAGRSFSASDDRPGAEPVVLIGDAMWRVRFQGRADVVGRTLKVNGLAHTIVGVMPPGFRFPEFAELWMPLAPSAAAWPRTDRSLTVVARLATDVQIQQARAEMRTIAAAQELANPATNARWTAQVTTLREDITGETAIASIVFLAAVGFVLLIACANVANLLLVRAVERRREIAIRLALGANRFRIARLVWTESLTFAVAGGTLGTLLALWLARALVAAFAVETPYWITFGMDWHVALFCIAVTAATAVLCGVAPALQAFNRDVRSTLQDGPATSGGSKSRGLRHALVAVQLALALVLLAGAGLMIKTILHAYRFDIGYDAARVLQADLTLTAPRYQSEASKRAFATALIESLERIPDVRAAVSRTIFFRGFGGESRRVALEGTGELPPDASPGFYFAVTPSYFATLGVPVLQGRNFTSSDAATVVVVNRELAGRIWGSRSPLGSRIRFGAEGPWLDVIGVVADFGGSPFGIARRAAYAYVPLSGHETSSMSVSVSKGANVAAVGPDVRAAIHRLDPDLPVEDLMTGDEALARWTQPARFVAMLMGGLSFVAILLAALGTYGVMAYGVAQRTREIGIRIALGATARDVQQLLVGAGLRVLAAGLAGGLLAAWLCTRMLRGILAGTSPTDPIVFTAVAITLAVVGLVACWIPSRRALRVDPTIALRAE